MRKILFCVMFVMVAPSLTSCAKNDQNDVVETLPAATLINPNTADAASLGRVSGLSEAGVKAILSGRPFSGPAELHQALSQVVEAQAMSGIYNSMFIKVDLNTASEADLKLIPSTLSPSKLAHEFDEYRPYENIEQFRQEIGKYVDEKELAHLERYVTIN